MNTQALNLTTQKTSVLLYVGSFIFAAVMNSPGQIPKELSRFHPTFNHPSGSMDSRYLSHRQTRSEAKIDSIFESRKIRSMYQPNPGSDVTINQTWRDNHWINESRESYSYDDQNNWTNIVQLWKNEGWTPYQRSHSYSNENGNISEYTIENWIGTDWTIHDFSHYEYNSDRQLIYSWNYTKNEIENDLLYKYITYYTYNIGLLTTTIDSSWDKNMDVWHTIQTTISYDSIGRRTENISQRLNDNWVYGSKTTTIYDDENNMNQSTQYFRYHDTEDWAPSFRNTNYDNEQNNERHTIGEEWKNNTWEIKYRYHYQFSPDLNSDTYTYEYYDNGTIGTKEGQRSSYTMTHSIYLNQPVTVRINLLEKLNNEQWINDTKSVHLWDNQGYWLGNTNQRWENGVWENISRSFPEENQLVDSELFPEKFSLANYPNPFNSSTTILFRVPQTADVKLTIFDLMGRSVAELENGRFENGLYQSTWSGRDDSGRSVPSGVYIIHLTVGNSRESKKIILTK